MEHLQNVQKIFADKLLSVPDYQRGCAWEQKHLEDLIEDLELLETEQEHYTGTLVLHPSDPPRKILDTSGQSLTGYDVVDGQQRLTTIVLLLDAIRREIKRSPELSEMESGIRRSYIMTKDRQGGAYAKLTLNRDTREYFERCIIADEPSIDGPSIRSQWRLREAQEFFRKYLERLRRKNENEFPEILVSLLRKITEGLKLTVYEVPRAAEVGVIFEVMNNRGKPLSELDKVKNYLLYLTSKISTDRARQCEAAINAAWTAIFERLTDAGVSDREDQLLRAHWIMGYDYQRKNWHGSDSIKTRFSRNMMRERPDEILSALDSYVSSLRDFSLAYCDIIAPGRSDAFSAWPSEVRSRVTHAAEKILRLANIAPFIPLLCALRLRNQENGEIYLHFLELCELYSFRVYGWAERRSDAGQKVLFRLGHDIYHRRISHDDAGETIRATLLYYSPDDEFESDVQRADASHANGNWYNWDGLKYFLYEYEEHLASQQKKPVENSWNSLKPGNFKHSIEHILPQSPTKEWRERWSKEQIHRYTHDIGNLTLTYAGDNPAYGNKDFQAKKSQPADRRCYANSSFFMERALTRYDQWTEKELLARRAAIIDWALKRWKVDPPNRTLEIEEDDEDGE